MRARYSIPLFAALFALAAFLLFFRLGFAPLWDYDESTYAIVTHEALTQGHVLTPYFMERPFLEKPPLFFWMTEASALSLGESEFSLRLPSALTGLFLIAAVALLALELSGDAWTALLAGAIALTTAPILEVARQVRMDVPVTLFITLAAYGFVRGLRDPRWFLLFGISAALAVLTKSVVAVFAFAAAPVFAVWLRDLSWFKNVYFWAAIALGGLIALPWHVYEALRYGTLFWQSYLGFSVVERISQNLFAAPQSTNQDYMWYLANFALPWTQVFVLGLVPLFAYWRALPLRTRRGAGACASMVFLILAVFFTAATKAPTYLEPLYPFAAVALGLIIAGFMRAVRGVPRVLLGAGLSACLALGFYSTVYNGFHLNPYYAPTDELSSEEKAVGRTLAGHPASVWYVFGSDTDVGAEMYYAGRVDPKELLGGELRPGDLVLMYVSQRAAFFAAHPVSTVALYAGKQLLLLEVVSED